MGYPSLSIVAICMFSLFSRNLLISDSVTGFGMLGIACITFIVPIPSTFDINIEKRSMCSMPTLPKDIKTSLDFVQQLLAIHGQDSLPLIFSKAS